MESAMAPMTKWYAALKFLHTSLLFCSDAIKNCENRPIIFVAHSLGGLVVKQVSAHAPISQALHEHCLTRFLQALIIAKSNAQYENISKSTYGLVFFGVPHQGGNGAGIGVIAKNLVASITGNAHNSLVESLKENSVFSDTQRKLFKDQLLNYRIMTFVEGRPTKFKKIGGIFRSATSKVCAYEPPCFSLPHHLLVTF
jgi:hypothetical protein